MILREAVSAAENLARILGDYAAFDHGRNQAKGGSVVVAGVTELDVEARGAALAAAVDLCRCIELRCADGDRAACGVVAILLGPRERAESPGSDGGGVVDDRDVELRRHAFLELDGGGR